MKIIYEIKIVDVTFTVLVFMLSAYFHKALAVEQGKSDTKLF